MIHRVCGPEGSCGVGGTVSYTAHTMCAHSVHTNDVCIHGTPAQMPCSRICARRRGASEDTLNVCASTFILGSYFVVVLWFFISPKLLSIALEGVGFPLLYSSLMLLLILKCAESRRHSGISIFQFHVLLSAILAR